MTNPDWTGKQAPLQLILSLRLLIARAANGDSLAWWDDQSLTAHAAFILERTFPVAPAQAARSLALRAALARHQALCPGDSLHLYRLDGDNRDRLILRFHSLESITLPEQPITTVDALRRHLAYRVERHREALASLARLAPVDVGGWQVDDAAFAEAELARVAAVRPAEPESVEESVEGAEEAARLVPRRLRLV